MPNYQIFSALSDKNRFQIIQILARGPRCVCELEKSLGIAQNLLSHHLGVLRQVGLVSSCPCGKKRHYSLNRGRLQLLEKTLTKLTKQNV
ncbi:MAG: metalloregulator ArsR/SmtB family transcription factor [Candidatus Gracilibacteria bacterium]|nr:metalloregulator ArsR/SmtB family transcription factor [Candidatus Gracilibacteria bacterium]